MSFMQGLFGPPNVEQLKTKHDVKGLIKALDYQKDSDVREAAAMALGELMDAQVIEPLLVALKDYKNVRQAATEALVKIGPLAVEPLITVLEDNDKNARQAAAEALVKIGTPSVKPLIAAIEDSDRNIHTVSSAVLTEICAQRKDDVLLTQVTETFIKALREVEESIIAAEVEKKSMEEKNPLIGMIGLMVCSGSPPPPGLENSIQDSESKFDNLKRKLSNYKKVETEWGTILSALTGKNFKKSSEWDTWFRKEHQ